MAIHYRTLGIILRKTERGEADQLFTIYTKDFGRLEILGKAIRKIKSKLRSGTELFYLSEIEFIQGKTYKTLTDSILVEKFGNLKKSLKRIAVAHKISEIFDELIIEQEPDKRIWELLNEVFNKLNRLEIRKQPFGESLVSLDPGKLEIIYYYFLWNLLSLLGYKLELYSCTVCQKKLEQENLFFAPKEGGIICHQCQNLVKSAEKVESETIKILRVLLKKDWNTIKKLKIEKNHLEKLKKISEDYHSYILKELTS